MVEVGQNEGVSRLADDFTDGQVLLHHYGVKGSPEFVAVTTDRVHRGADRADLLFGVG
ncbi:hypothetical protein D3C78_1879810 [compost metagenome]